MRTKKKAGRRDVKLLIVAILASAAVFFWLQPILSYVQYLYEDISYAHAPSAALAFSYGERHFNATDTSHYDIARAQHFFQLAAAQDPSYPYVYHELARISFLRGNFPLALGQINFEIDQHGTSVPHSYYIRALIEAYMQQYAAAEGDYRTTLTLIPVRASDPNSWATENDYAWVLIKDGKYAEAIAALREGLAVFPQNAWLLNTESIALYESGDKAEALEASQKAVAAANQLTLQDWLIAYPGNDPRIAEEGLSTFQKSAEDNMHTIISATSSSALR